MQNVQALSFGFRAVDLLTLYECAPALHLNVSCSEDVPTVIHLFLLWFRRGIHIREVSYLRSDAEADMGGNKLRHAARHRAPLLASSVSVMSRIESINFITLQVSRPSLHHFQPLPVYHQVFMPNLR